MRTAVVRLDTSSRRQRRLASPVGLAVVGVCCALMLGGCASLSGPQGGGGTPLQQDVPKVSTSAIKLTPRSLAIYDILTAELMGQAGDPKQALAYYLKALDASPEPALAQRIIAIATYLGDNEAALIAARRWIELESQSADAQRAAGVIEARAGHALRATQSLHRFVVLGGRPYGRNLALVGALLSQGVDREVALQIMRALANDFPREPYAHYALGSLALHFGDNAQALGSAERALALKPDFKEALVLKAEAQVAMNQTERGLRTLKDALAVYRGDVALQLAYANLLVQAKHYDAARGIFRDLLKQHPHNADVLYMLGLLDYQSGRDAEARGYLQRLLQTGQHAAAAEYFLGRIAERGGDMSAAIRHYSNVDSGPYQFDARVRVAYILAGQGDLEQARQYLAQLRASVSDPAQKVDLYLVEGELLERAADGAQAMNLYNEALSRHPGNQQLLYARALLADKLGNIGQAEADLSYIVQHHPDNAMALNALGYTLADRTRRYQEALGYIQRALALKPGDPAILDSMGWVQYRLKHYAEALRYLREAYAKFKDPEVAAHLIEVLFVGGHRAEALQTLRAALKAYPGNAELEKIKQRFVP